MKLAKKYWWLFLLVVVTPIVMNIFMIQPKFFTFVGNDSSWLGFWGSYIGAVLSSAIALFVLFLKSATIIQYTIKGRFMNR